ncbi:MAG TPA: YihA family ribosome biogenesis GTP-binding protein [Opitutae bacterium]|nr:YihA family ribosome biogenesis GTP-binding protein [Opitutae bacterium]
MKIDSARFIASATDLEACPPSNQPEFAFVGRSNVGKSSLINMLTNSKQLAKTSGTPGKTKLINLFRINNAWTLVDLPGYGYAKLSKQKQHDFNIHVSEYLNERENLKHIFLLVDSMLEPLDGDLAFAEWLQECGLPYSIIFTKTDRSSDAKVKNHSGQFLQGCEAWGLKPHNTYSCSAKTKQGRGQIMKWIESQLPKKKKGKTSPTINVGWMKKR